MVEKTELLSLAPTVTVTVLVSRVIAVSKPPLPPVAVTVERIPPPPPPP
jgi:hypothetical protein